VGLRGLAEAWAWADALPVGTTHPTSDGWLVGAGNDGMNGDVNGYDQLSTVEDCGWELFFYGGDLSASALVV
jgi:hypothetical protein